MPVFEIAYCPVYEAFIMVGKSGDSRFAAAVLPSNVTEILKKYQDEILTELNSRKFCSMIRFAYPKESEDVK